MSAAASDAIRRPTKEGYLLGDRSLGSTSMALSIAATWIWAPALFLASQLGYQYGWWGVFWITVPNALCLMLFGYLAQRLRDKHPHGFTFTGYLRERFGSGVFAIGVIEDSVLSIAAFAVQLLAGSLLLSQLSGLPYVGVVAGVSLVVLAYTYVGGFRASVVTDHVYMLLIVGGIALIVPWAIAAAGASAFSAPAGVSGADGMTVFLVFGLSATIGWIAGPFADQQFWQRAYATDARRVSSTFTAGALVFAVVPALLGVLGVVAAGAGIVTDNPQMVGLAAVSTLLPPFAVAVFAVVLVAGLVSTMDSALSAQSSLVAADFGGSDDDEAIRRGRRAMIAVTIAAAGIALIPGLTILHLLLTYGTLRAAAFAPGVLAIFRDYVDARGAFWGVLLGLTVGMPLFVYGALMGGGAGYQIAGSLAAVGLGGVVTIAATWWTGRERFVRLIESPHGEYAELRQRRGGEYFIAYDPGHSFPEDFAVLERDPHGYYRVADYPAEARKLVR